MAKYYKNSQQQIQFLIDTLSITSQSKGVDLGCQSGEHLQKLQNISPTIYGIDLKKFSNLKNFYQLDFFREDIPLSNLDFAYCLSPYFDTDWWKIEDFLENVHSCLKMNGHFILDLFHYHTMKVGDKRQTHRLTKSEVTVSTFTREPDRVSLQRTIIRFDGQQKHITGVWRVFTQDELVTLLDQQGFMILHQYGDFDKNMPLDWNTPISETKRLVIHAKKYR